MGKYLSAAIIIAASTLLAGRAGAGQNVPRAEPSRPSSSAEQEVLRLNSELAEAVERSDTAALALIYADDFAGTGFGGQPVSKAEMTASNNTPTAALVYYVEDDVNVKAFGETAVVTSRAALRTRLADGSVISRRNAVTRVWVRRGDRWHVVASHMSPMALQAPPPEGSTRAQGRAGGPWRHLGKVEQEALAAHLDYLKQPPAPEWAERRYAPGFFTTAATGVASDREEIIRRLKGEAGRGGGARPASPEVVVEENRVLFRTNDATVALDEFRAQADDDVVTFSYRATSINRGGQLTGQLRVGGAYVKQGGRWRQVFGQTTEVIAHSTRQ